MRCKACDCVLRDNELVTRVVEVNGKDTTLFEDLCRDCRRHAMLYVEDDDVVFDIPKEIIDESW